MQRVFRGRISESKGLTVGDRSGFASHLRSFDVGADVDVIVRPHKSQRSTPQNRRYWALVTVGAREIGYDDPEELHEGLALKFLKLPPLADGLPRRRRTPSLNTLEFTDYCDAVERFFRIDLNLDLSGWDEEIEKLEAA